MARLLKLRRGTTSQHSSFTGAEGECTVDTTKDTLVVHDNSTAGGRPLLREDLNNIGTGTVTHAMLAGDCIDGDNLADNACNSEHYTDGSIDHVHLAGDCIDGDNLADNACNSEHYTDGSIDHVHLAGDAVDGDNIADNSINSEHYVDGSIDEAHIADNQVSLAKMAGIARGKIIYGDSSGNPAVLAVGSADQVLTTDGTDISWGNASAGATGGNSNANKIFWENEQTVTHAYTIQNNHNAGSFGPITINSGVTVTVGSGENWTVV